MATVNTTSKLIQTMSISDLKQQVNQSILNRVGKGDQDIIITSHGFPIAKITVLTAEDRGLAIPTPYVPPQTAWLGGTLDPTANVTVVSTSNAIPIADLEVNAVKAVPEVPKPSLPLGALTLKALEDRLAKTPVADFKVTRELLHYILKQRPFTVTEAALFRDCMATDTPKPSDDGT